ncbi:MAG: hypothetical protein RBU28_00490 [Bacteroidales bacterium]|jgi:hypothetical protein|nr:hypothetical protein [Bacteroidales bacterium]
MKARPIILMTGILIIGFILGMLTSAQLRLHKLRPVMMYFSEDHFTEGFYKIIQPDDQQKARIEQVLKKYARLNGELQEDLRKDMETNWKEFRKELDSNLTKEQLARLREFDERRDEMIRESRRRFSSDSTGFGNRSRNPGTGRRPGPPPPPPDPRSFSGPDSARSADTE